jgi:hypothetical protein
VYTRRVARLRVSHSRRRCVQPLRASRNARDSTVVTPGRSNRVVGRIDSCLSGVIPPVEGKRTVRESVWEIPGPCTPVCTPPHVPRTFAFRTRPRFRISGDEISRPRSSAARVGRAFLSVPSVSRSHTTATRHSPRRTARERGARTGERVRAAGARGAREARQGVRVGGTRPGGPEIRREPGTSWLRSRRSRGVPLGFS